MPAESVHTVCTSPPYWGLRDYKLEPQVWGGDAGCEHNFANEDLRVEVGAGNWTQAENGPGLASGRQQTRFRGDTVAARESTEWAIVQRGFCRKCAAWRGSLGLEPTPDLYVQHLVEIFREVRRVLRRDGTVWCNLGDSYAASPKGNLNGQDKSGLTSTRTQENSPVGVSKITAGLKPKDLLGMPWRLAFALQADGWWLRSDIIWSKPNPMPESVTDRPTKAHEFLFLLSKAANYYYDTDAIRDPALNVEWPGIGPKHGESGERLTNRDRAYAEGMEARAGRNKRTVWEIPTEPYPEAHFATYPQKLVEPCILAGSSEKGCCPECGAPWERVVEASGGTMGRSWHDHRDDLVVGQRKFDPGGYQRRETGWKPSCAHGLTPVPATVLDIFAGSGTTLLVAQRLGRNGVGIELSEEYCRLAVRRLAGEHGQMKLAVRLEGR